MIIIPPFVLPVELVRRPNDSNNTNVVTRRTRVRRMRKEEEGENGGAQELSSFGKEGTRRNGVFETAPVTGFQRSRLSGCTCSPR